MRPVFSPVPGQRTSTQFPFAQFLQQSLEPFKASLPHGISRTPYPHSPSTSTLLAAPVRRSHIGRHRCCHPAERAIDALHIPRVVQPALSMHLPSLRRLFSSARGPNSTARSLTTHRSTSSTTARCVDNRFVAFNETFLARRPIQTLSSRPLTATICLASWPSPQSPRRPHAVLEEAILTLINLYAQRGHNPRDPQKNRQQRAACAVGHFMLIRERRYGFMCVSNPVSKGTAHLYRLLLNPPLIQLTVQLEHGARRLFT